MNDTRTETARLLTLFEGAGAERVEADILQPAGTLLDLYGEDIRGRAYVTNDPLRGELMMRPDFTVPVVQRHMEERAEPARYTYAGPVFRQQDFAAERPSEHIQVGYEVFDRGNAEKVEAEVFAMVQSALDHLPIRAVMGDIGLLVAAVDALTTSAARKAALKRHIWRPTRFAALLDRFSKPTPLAVPGVAGPQIGLRNAADVADRWTQLQAEAELDPIPMAEVAAVKAVLNAGAPLPQAAAVLADVSQALPGLRSAITRLEDRVTAFEAAGIKTQAIEFRTTYGLTAMEYYDGFVFGFYADNADWPPVATGGRYDALTRVLGQGRDVPAVGGVIRPELTAELAQ